MPRSQTVRDRYIARLSALGHLRETLEKKANEALADVAHIDRVAFRVKDVDSFEKKAIRPKYASPFAEIEDQVAGRVITFFLDDIAVVRERLEGLFGSVEHVVKEPAGDDEFGYESEHFVFVIAEHHKPDDWQAFDDMPSTFEVQIRTIFMHAWAEPQHDLGYKSTAPIDRDTRRELAWIAASSWGADRALNDVAKRLVISRSAN